MVLEKEPGLIFSFCAQSVRQQCEPQHTQGSRARDAQARASGRYAQLSFPVGQLCRSRLGGAPVCLYVSLLLLLLLSANFAQPGLTVFAACMRCVHLCPAYSYVKNRIKRSWDQARNERLASLGATPSNQVPIPQSDRDAIKASILQTLITVPAQVRVHVASALGVIARCDFPAQWPDLMDKVGQLISSNEPQNVYGGIRALLEVIRAYK